VSLPRTAAAGAALALSGLAVFGLQAPASAAPTPKPTKSNCPNPAGAYPPGQCGTSGQGSTGSKGSVGDDTPQPGTTTHVHGEGFKGSSDVDVEAHSAVFSLGTFRTSAAGVLDADVTIPLGLPVGPHSIVLVGIAPDGTSRVVSIPISITAAAAAAARAAQDSGGTGVLQLPTTGAEIASVAVAGLVLVGVGSAAVISGRRRRLTAA
jgi:LPXTG-motif cell wall-anchored protein